MIFSFLFREGIHLNTYFPSTKSVNVVAHLVSKFFIFKTLVYLFGEFNNNHVFSSDEVLLFFINLICLVFSAVQTLDGML